jgi:hypothetical protein
MGLCGEGLEYGRFRISSKISASETYTDNVFQSPDDTQEDFITRIAPNIRMDFALAPNNIIGAGYEGRYSFYTNFDNLERHFHKPYFSWTFFQPKGSKLIIGASKFYGSYLPESEEDERKDYDLTRFNLDSSIKLGAFTEYNIKLAHGLRRFDHKIDTGDEYDKNTFSLNLVYHGLDFTSPLIEYRYIKQDNNDQIQPSTDYSSHTILGGLQWRAQHRLSGTIKIGYRQTNFEEIRDSDGIDYDVGLQYEISNITGLDLIAFRRIERSTQAARETENYLVSSALGVSLSYTKFDPLKIVLNLLYTNKDFENRDLGSNNHREDNVYRFDLRTIYAFEQWLHLSMGYNYNRNDSNVISADYKENGFTLRLTASF